MPRSTYIGYTATPFANVFINPVGDEDLYPKTFILNLPRPDGYFGPEKIFGRDVLPSDGDAGDGPVDGYDMVRTVPEEDVHLLRPGSRDDAASFEPVMLDELVKAVRWFWLATAARRARGDVGHSTMLIHTSVKIAVHESYRAPLEGLRARAIREVTGGDAAPLAQWRQLWEDESARVQAEDFDREQNTFEDVLPHLPTVVASTRVVLDNFRSQDRLDYSEPSVVAIAVGGNTLSRGLTLEGLVVSFFIRGATAYDTLLQMGRWFGYRTGYEDLPRIWMTPSLADAFRHLATVEHEMRDDIDRYQRENLTPVDVAVRIRTHPALRITAKMGAAQPAYVLYAGRRLQTRYFNHRDVDWLRANQRATEELLKDARQHGKSKDSVGAAILFRDVPVSVVKKFLASYRVHGDSPDLDTELMIRYIDRQLASDPPTLKQWSVAVVSGDTGDRVDVGGVDVGYLVRSRLNDKNVERADIKTLMSKEDRVLDLGIGAADARRLSEDDLIERRNEDPVNRDRGLVVIYPIDQVSPPGSSDGRGPGAEPARVALDAASPVYGMGIVFPGDRTAHRVQATHVSVDLTDVESTDLDEALDIDTEGSP